MTGPCLCGDTYCSSCGDPSLASYEAAIENLTDKLFEKKMSEFELSIFERVGFEAVEAHRAAMDNINAEQNYDPRI